MFFLEVKGFHIKIITRQVNSRQTHLMSCPAEAAATSSSLPVSSDDRLVIVQKKSVPLIGSHSIPTTVCKASQRFYGRLFILFFPHSLELISIISPYISWDISRFLFTFRVGNCHQMRLTRTVGNWPFKLICYGQSVCMVERCFS